MCASSVVIARDSTPGNTAERNDGHVRVAITRSDN